MRDCHLKLRPRTPLAALLAACAALAGGCAGSGGSIGDVNSGLACVDDTPHCIKSRQYALNSLVNSKDAAWVGQPASAKTYASGVRLFAFKKRKTTLTCAQLKSGQKEAQKAPTVLRGPGANSLTPAQISRGKMFAGEVATELRREIKKRC